jgi:hypothetical protein
MGARAPSHTPQTGPSTGDSDGVASFGESDTGLAHRLAGSVTVDRQLKSEWASDEVNELHGVNFIGRRAALNSRHSGGRVPVTGEL